MPPIAIVLNGASSSGKTSIAKALQKVWPMPLLHASLDAHVDVFDWSVIPDNDLRSRCHAFGLQSFHTIIEVYAQGPFSLVIDHVFEQPAWRVDCLRALGSLRTLQVAVHCPLEIVEQREQARGDRRLGLAKWQWDRVHRGANYDIELNTSHQSPEGCADLILKHVSATSTHLRA